jgi:hypothetical protein
MAHLLLSGMACLLYCMEKAEYQERKSCKGNNLPQVVRGEREIAVRRTAGGGP